MNTEHTVNRIPVKTYHKPDTVERRVQEDPNDAVSMLRAAYAALRMQPKFLLAHSKFNNSEELTNAIETLFLGPITNPAPNPNAFRRTDFRRSKS